MYDDAELVTPLFIDGHSCPSSSGKTIPIFNPARPQELVGHVAGATVQDVERACAAAHKAFPAWAL